MKLKSLFVIAFCFVFGLAVFTGCGDDSAIPEAETEETIGDTLVVGMSCDFVPFNWEQEEAGEATLPIRGEKTFAGGYDVRIASLIGEELNVDVEIVKKDRSDLIGALEDGDIDLMISGVNPTDTRADRIDFSESYYDCDYVAVVLKDGKYADAVNISQFKGAKITGQTDSYIYTDLLPQMKGITVAEPLTFYSDMRVALANGVVDGYVALRSEGMSATIAHPEFAMVVFNENGGFETEPEFATVAIGVKKDRTELLEEINTVLHGITKEDRLLMMDYAVYEQPLDEEE